MRTWLVCFGACAMLAGCSDKTQTGDDNDPSTSDPNDPVICVGDVDTGATCKKTSEFWDCASMPNGEKKCGFKVPQNPGGTGTWSCEKVGEQIVCKSQDAGTAPTGSATWTCTVEGEFTVCKEDVPAPPPGGGTWDCSLDSEFNWSCTSKDEGSTTPDDTDNDNPDNTTPPVPSGISICYTVGEGATGMPTPPEGYWAKIVAQRVIYNGVEALHYKLFLTKVFVDNTYGDYAVNYQGGPSDTQIGGGHSFGDLLESDKMQIYVDDPKGNLIFHVAMDYFSSTGGSSWDCLGVDGGEGQMFLGNKSDVLAIQTSLDVNFNTYGYKLTSSSPKTDINYTPDPQYPNWIFDVWYEGWVKWSAFGSTGPGRVYITGLHASPNKVAKGTLEMVPTPCP